MQNNLLLSMGFSFLSGAPDLMAESHRHKEVEINLVAVGEMTYLFGGGVIGLSPGQVALFWATIPHRVIRLAPGTRYYCIHLPLASFLQWELPETMTSRLLHGEMVREADPGKAPRDHALFEQWRVDLESPCPETNGILLLEIQARLRRLALTLPAADSPKAHPHGPAPGEIDKVEAMALLIATSYSQPITAAEIASHVRLHPKYAMALFRRHCGITLGEYLTQQRLSQAQRLLVTTDSKVNDIAYSSGFGSVSRFYEVFGQSCGMSPKAYRASLRR